MIAYGDVATALREVDVDEGDIEELYGFLESQGVELVDDVDPARSPTRRRSPPRASAASAASPRLWT